MHCGVAYFSIRFKMGFNGTLANNHAQRIPAHVGNRGNENADKLAKAALHRASNSRKLICWSDLKPKVNAYIYTVWQENWDAEGANKLHEELPNLGEDLSKRGEGAGRKCVGFGWATHGSIGATF
ncbi:ribonuclease hi [Plakobranchus ocellatus]|uniref:Ribonuclease hi n=1 Tax=Plakobranchus ocellatus TaxID=259542 RepID=A0AAV4D8X7_9GAST|nr:ribonuclease hi [Plakobranchus ocellatus]